MQKTSLTSDFSLDESSRQRARRAIIAAKKGWLPTLDKRVSTSSLSRDPFAHVGEHSIETTNSTKFGRNSVLTRSARMRKYSFYQFKPKADDQSTLESSKITDDNNHHRSTTESNINDTTSNNVPSFNSAHQDTPDSILETSYEEDQTNELIDLDKQIDQLDNLIADLKKNDTKSNTRSALDLVNQKNDLLRRQMQLNISEHEKRLELEKEKLTKELRVMLTKSDNNKTKQELERQQYLNDQILYLINKRNELVHQLDIQERGIADDNAQKESSKFFMAERNADRWSRNSQDQCTIQ